MIKVYAISDSHQETRKTCAFLSKILQDCENCSDFEDILFLNCGDIFKGIYPKDLERDCYIRAKQQNPDIQMVMTIGNNDFGFNRESFEYFIETVELFRKNGIYVVNSNIFNSSMERFCWLEPYKIINLNNKRIFVSGFCINNLNVNEFNIKCCNQEEVIEEIYQAILKEKPDKIILLNHDYMDSSIKLQKKFFDKGIKVDLIIGGHDHEKVEPDESLKIFYPQAFSSSMYEINLDDTDKNSKNENFKLICNEECKIQACFEKDLEKYEKESKLYLPIAPFTLNLYKKYSNPCPLGSFLADSMKEVSSSDIAFFSTGFTMRHLKYQPNAQITNYIFKETITADTPIMTVELTSAQLKEIFSHALEKHNHQKSNPRFLQCSNNIKIEGRDNPKKEEFEIKQIYINNKPILDKNQIPLNPQIKYKTAIDSFIAKGGQGFKTLKNLEKSLVYSKIINESANETAEEINRINPNNPPVKINEVLLNALKQAPEKYPKGSEYPYFELIELI